jgi:hypothetical protein
MTKPLHGYNFKQNTYLLHTSATSLTTGTLYNFKQNYYAWDNIIKRSYLSIKLARK